MQNLTPVTRKREFIRIIEDALDEKRPLFILSHDRDKTERLILESARYRGIAAEKTSTPGCPSPLWDAAWKDAPDGFLILADPCGTATDQDKLLNYAEKRGLRLIFLSDDPKAQMFVPDKCGAYRIPKPETPLFAFN